ncbi:hypothetical protein LJC46_02275 [Desulfovibrio sp. OttesenSCG-928-G15]|nr:hypothetical protein [Desulfovibrio sp. OttesenSCG-928-G15]
MCLHPPLQIKHPDGLGRASLGLYEGIANMACLITHMPGEHKADACKALVQIMAQMRAVNKLEDVAGGLVSLRDPENINNVQHGLGPEAEAVLLQASQN